MDCWFMDDETLVTPPLLFHEALIAFDIALKEIGVTRGEGMGVKSIARIVCPESEVEYWTANQAWATEHVRNTCIVLQPNTPTEYLGTVIGGAPERTKSMIQALQKVADKRTAICNLGHAGAELIMLRRVTDVTCINYWLRCQGDAVD